MPKQKRLPLAEEDLLEALRTNQEGDDATDARHAQPRESATVAGGAKPSPSRQNHP